MSTDHTSIAWTDATWNPVRGCSLISAGCTNCYAMRQAARMAGSGGAYEGLVRESARGSVWTGDVQLVSKLLDQPMRWTKPRMVFVNSMSDVFHEKLTREQIAAVFGAMAAAPQHTFQVLTKRAERMLEWTSTNNIQAYVEHVRQEFLSLRGLSDQMNVWKRWPLPNVWFGVSVEDQRTADERIPLLLRTPAVMRFVSYEPALAAVKWGIQHGFMRTNMVSAFRSGLDWLIIGGESGPYARPFDLTWARATIAACKTAGVACFYKQGGVSNACAHDQKGGHFDCFPDDLKIREYPRSEWRADPPPGVAA